MATSNYRADFNDLIAEAQAAMDALDYWDEGKTWAVGFARSEPRVCSLEVLAEEHDAAVAKVVRFAQQWGYDIMRKDDDHGRKDPT